MPLSFSTPSIFSKLEPMPLILAPIEVSILQSCTSYFNGINDTSSNHIYIFVGQSIVTGSRVILTADGPDADAAGAALEALLLRDVD